MKYRIIFDEVISFKIIERVGNMNDRKFNFIDLFAGAGGLSEGFVADGNFVPIAHVEMNKDACDTLKTRSCYYYLKENNLLNIYKEYQQGLITKETLYSYVDEGLVNTVINNEIDETSTKEIFLNIDSIIKKEEVGELDLIIGGPPCQAYSLVGRAVSSNNMETDPRNFLYKQYIKFLDHFKPKMFIFENVPGILTAQKGATFSDIINEFDKAGYRAEYKILNAADFGVLQNRRRVIIIGWRKQYELEYPSFDDCNIDIDVTVANILSDLSYLERGQEKNEYTEVTNTYLEISGIRSSDDILTQHICRKHNYNDIEIYKLVIEAWNENHIRLKYSDLPSELQTHKNTTAFLDRYKVLAANVRLSHTMIAHIAKDGHYFIHPDINQCRSISVREAARIQSFPDNYFFEGSRAAKYVQIGNAVPPLMAKGLANKVKIMLEGIL